MRIDARSSISVIRRPKGGHFHAAHMIGSVVLGEPSLVSSSMAGAMRARIVDAENRFEAVVAKHLDFVSRTLLALGVPSTGVDDAAQQVFLVAAQKLDAIEAGAERAFLFAIARGVAANVRRSRARSRELADEDVLDAQLDDTPDPEELCASKRDREMLERLLDGLTDEVRPIFVLHEIEGLTMAEIARVCDLAHGTVASRLRRARDAFHAAARRLRLGQERLEWR
jgi:RNA polymerase sigma-70 factor (ECF subfamily)